MNKQPIRNRMLAMAGVAAAVWGAAPAFSAVIVTQETTSDSAVLASWASNSDLLQTALVGSIPVTNYVKATGSNGDISVLVNGKTGANGFNYPETVTEHDSSKADGWTADFHLDVSAHVHGYDISCVVSISSFSSPLVRQKFQLYVHQVGQAADVWQQIGSSDFVTTALSKDSAKLTVAAEVGVMASAVDAIRFVHVGGTNTTNDRGSYRELDVLGSPTIPEPSAISLLALGTWLVCPKRR